MNDTDIELVQELSDMATKQMYRAIIFARVLEHLGYNPRNIQQASKAVLANIILKRPEDIINDCQMR